MYPPFKVFLSMLKDNSLCAPLKLMTVGVAVIVTFFTLLEEIPGVPAPHTEPQLSE